MSWDRLITKIETFDTCGKCGEWLKPGTEVLMESPDNPYSRCHVVGCPSCMTREEMKKLERP